MRFTTVFTVIACGALAVASVLPAAIVKRQDTDVSSVLDTLKTNTDTILPQFAALGDTPDADSTSALVDQLAAALDDANTSLNAISPSRKRQTDDATAAQTAAIVENITNTINDFKGHGGGSVPGFDLLIVKIDLNLSVLLKTLEFLIPGLLVLVGELLGGVLLLLKGLGFVLTAVLFVL